MTNIQICITSWALSRDQLTKFYFTPDFWFILFGRLFSISWLIILGNRKLDFATSDNEHDNNNSYNNSANDDGNRARCSQMNNVSI